MAIQVIKSKRALAQRKGNPRSNWPHPIKGSERLFPIPLPGVKATFKIKEDEEVFCIGSCFAREVEKTLDQMGIPVSSLKVCEGLEGEGMPPLDAFLNKYTVPSILQELQMALEPSSMNPAHCLVEVADGMFHDYQLAGGSLERDFASMAALRHSFSRQFSSIRDVDVIILTLGLSEVWFDREAGLYLNTCPAPKVFKRHPERFELRVLEYEETLQGLEAIYELLARHLKGGFRILLTVSPVPLLSTFRDVDVLVANAYSKSLLRTAAEVFLTRHGNVNYFPSFEMVGLGPQDVVWGGRGDFRHVNRDFVEVIMCHALESFLEAPGDGLMLQKHEAMVRCLVSGGRMEDALRVLDRWQGPESRNLKRLRLQVESSLACPRGPGDAPASFLRRLEAWCAARILSERHLKKYKNARYAYFADSKSALLRYWGKLTR